MLNFLDCYIEYFVQTDKKPRRGDFIYSTEETRFMYAGEAYKWTKKDESRFNAVEMWSLKRSWQKTILERGHKETKGKRIL